MKKRTFLASIFLGLSFTFGLVELKAADITFEVDMTGFTPSSNGVRVVGSFGGAIDWNNTANSMAPIGNNIFATTITLEDNKNFKFKFMNGNAWGTEESVPASITGGPDRYIQTGTSNATIRFAYNGLPLAGFSMVTFKVDMTGTTLVAPIYIVGGQQGWEPTNTVLTQVGTTSVYERSLYVLTGATVDYKFKNGGTAWNNLEDMTGKPCANAGNNRTFLTSAATATAANVFNSCDTPTALESTSANAISIFPIPATDQLNFSGIDGVASVSIINSTGSVVKNVEIEGSASISISELPAGLYLVQITTDNNIVVKKITKQ